MKFGLVLPYGSAQSFIHYTRAAEKAGWDGCFSGDAIWCEDPMIALAAAAVQTERIRLGITIIPVPLRRPWKLASESVSVQWAPNPGAFLYSVEANHKRIFYATDTAAFQPETWKYFTHFGLHFDIMIFYHTYGPDQEASDHLSAQEVIDHVKCARSNGILKPSGRALATHISHEGNPTHSELSEFASKNGYEIAYDGLTIEI